MPAPTTSKKNCTEKNVIFEFKTMELSEIFWKKADFETEYLSRSFDITRADIRKIFS